MIEPFQRLERRPGGGLVVAPAEVHPAHAEVGVGIVRVDLERLGEDRLGLVPAPELHEKLGRLEEQPRPRQVRLAYFLERLQRLGVRPLHGEDVRAFR